MLFNPPAQYYEYIDEDGVSHIFTCSSNCYSTEGHGYWLDGNGNVYGPDGSLLMIGLLEPDGRVTDANGNYTSLQNGETEGPYFSNYGVFTAYDTSNIPFFYQLQVNPSGQALPNTAGPFQDYLYHLPSMNSAGETEDYLEHDVTIQVDSAFHVARYPVAECVNSKYACTMQVISQIVLPDQTSFTFKYDCDSTIAAQQSYCTSPGGQTAYYGTLTKMITPTGQTFTYSYQPYFDVYQDATLGLVSRSNEYGTWNYSEAAISNCGGPSGSGIWNVGCEQTVTTVEPNGRTTVTTNIVNLGSWPVSELVTDGAGHNLSLTTTQWDFSHSNLWYGYGAAYIQKQLETETLWDSTGAAETKKTAYTYDSPETGNITVLQQWGYYPGTTAPSSSIADVTTYSAYYAPTNGPIVDSTMWNIAKGGTNVIDKPTSITVCNNIGTDSACPGGGSRVSQKLIYYDQYGSSGPAQVAGVTNHDDVSYGNSQLVRGNPTSVQQWVSGSQYVTQYMNYDTTGQVTSTKDGNGYVTYYDYTDSYYLDNNTSSPGTYAPSAPTHAYATTVTLPPVYGQSFSKKTGYYYWNQKPAFTTDINGNSTYYHYSDPLDRLTQSVYPLGWTLTQYTSPTETDVYRALSSPTPSSACLSCLHTSTIFDGLERVIQNVRADGSKVSTTYNSMGLVQSVSNPFQASSDSTYGLTSYVYDILDRVCMQNNSDNILSQTATCTAKGSSALELSYIVNGGYKTDENGNTWGYFYDPLARLASVSEPNGAATQYTHDILGNLLSVSQPSRLRIFTYDGLSRLVTAANPESGTVCNGTWSESNCISGYDGNGNLLSRTDARGFVTTYAYDAWNRLTSKSYSDGVTPISCYQYDAPGVTNGNGRLANAWTQSASAGACTATAPATGFLTKRSILAYDSMGRLLNELQYTLASQASGKTYAPAYTYDLAGNLLTSTDGTTPSPTTPGATLTFTNTLDGAGRLVTVTSNWSDATAHPGELFSTQAGSATPCPNSTSTPYSAFGALMNATFGIGPASNVYTLNRSFNNRLRTTCEVDTGSGVVP
jgi:YD repeat-containing protein